MTNEKRRLPWKHQHDASDIITGDLAGHLDDTSDAHDASAISFAPAGTIAATNVQAAIEEVASEAGGGAPATADYLVGTAQAGLSAEIVVGATPGGELGGTWGSPTVDATHSGSAHHAESHTSRHTDGGADELEYEKTIVFFIPSTLTTGAKPIRILAPRAMTVENVTASVNTAPTGAALIVDVNKNGTTMFTTQGNRPEIAISGTDDTSAVPDVTSIAQNDVITIDVDQIGSTIAGADLVVQVRCTLAVE